LYFDDNYFLLHNKLKLIAYFTLALKAIKIPKINTMSNTLKKKLGNMCDKDNNIVAFLIGQLGRDSTYSKQILSGSDMIQDCYDIINKVNSFIGGKLILLECKPIVSLCEYYENKGFIDITENNNELKQYIKFIN